MTFKRSVLLVCDYSLNYMGGAQIAFIRQVKALLGEGHPVTVLAPDAKKALANLRSPLLTIIEPRVKFTLPLIELPLIGAKDALRKRLASLLDEDRFAGVIVHSEFALAALALDVAKTKSLPVYQTVHTFFWQAPTALSIFAPLVTLFHTLTTGLKNSVSLKSVPKFRASTPINNALRSMTLRFTANVTGVISPSKHQAETLEKAGTKNVTVLSNVIQKVQRTEPEEPLRIVWAGRFAPEKRLHVALKAAQIIEQERENGAEIPAIKFDIAGGDPPKGYAASNVQFHGRVSNHEVTDLIKHASAVLVTSFGFDNQPVIALEGFAKEKPVIVSDPQLQSEFGDASILTQKPDAPGLANTLIELAKNPALLEPHAKAAAEYAGKRGAREHVQALMELISANN